MALRDTWHRSLVYFGLAEDPDYHETDLYEPETGTHATTGYDSPPAQRATVSRLGDKRRGQDEIDDIFSDDSAPARTRNLRPVGNGGGGGGTSGFTL